MTYASPANERWYVAARSGRQTALLLGPYPDHAAAAVHVERGRALTREQFGHDMKATFATFGVARVVTESAPVPRFTDTAGPGSDRARTGAVMNVTSVEARGWETRIRTELRAVLREQPTLTAAARYRAREEGGVEWAGA